MLLDRYGATNPKLFGCVARGTATPGSDIDILVEMNPADGNLLMRASGRTRQGYAATEAAMLMFVSHRRSRLLS
ncbi:nucleotidyltransferase family protein [Propionibacteriaceae bacterium Y1923]